MLPLEKTCAYDPLPNLVFRMPRVVVDQKAKFETDELFRKLSRESEVPFSFSYFKFVTKQKLEEIVLCKSRKKSH